MAYYSGMVRQHKMVGILAAVAVAMPGGLVAPIVHNVDVRGLVLISVRIATFAVQTRAGWFKPATYQSVTLPISNNMNMYGISHSTVINISARAVPPFPPVIASSPVLPPHTK